MGLGLRVDDDVVSSPLLLRLTTRGVVVADVNTKPCGIPFEIELQNNVVNVLAKLT